MSNSPPPAGRFLAAERRAWEARLFCVTLTLGMGFLDLTTQEWSTSGMQVINCHQPITAIPSRVMAWRFGEKDEDSRMIPWSTVIYGDTPWFCIGGATVNVCERHWWTPSSPHISAGASCRDIAARCTPPNLWVILGKMRFQTMIIHWKIEDVLLKGQKKRLK